MTRMPSTSPWSIRARDSSSVPSVSSTGAFAENAVRSAVAVCEPSWSTQVWNFWAPHVIYAPAQSRYIMYYSADADTSTMCIGIAEASRDRGELRGICVQPAEVLGGGPGVGLRRRRQGMVLEG